MSPADERRRLLRAAQRREPYRSDVEFGPEPSLRSSLYPPEAPRHRGWTFAAVSAGLVVGAVGMCWALGGSDSIAKWTQGAPDHAGTTEITSAPTAAVVAASPNAVPTTVQPAVVPAPPPPPVATETAAAPPLVPVESLPAAAARGPHHEPAGPTTIRVVETPEPVDTQETPSNE